MIYVEDLQVANMSKSAKGTTEERGKNVKQKSGLNRSILDQSWFEFRRQLDYKTQWLGGFLVAVPHKIPVELALVATIPQKKTAKHRQILNV